MIKFITAGIVALALSGVAFGLSTPVLTVGTSVSGQATVTATSTTNLGNGSHIVNHCYSWDGTVKLLVDEQDHAIGSGKVASTTFFGLTPGWLCTAELRKGNQTRALQDYTVS